MDEKLFQCTVCLDLCHECINCQKCSQIMCRKHVKNLRRCPSCRHTPFEFEDNVALQRVIQQYREKKDCATSSWDPIPVTEENFRLTEDHVEGCKPGEFLLTVEELEILESLLAKQFQPCAEFSGFSLTLVDDNVTDDVAGGQPGERPAAAERPERSRSPRDAREEVQVRKSNRATERRRGEGRVQIIACWLRRIVRSGGGGKDHAVESRPLHPTGAPEVDEKCGSKVPCRAPGMSGQFQKIPSGMHLTTMSEHVQRCAHEGCHRVWSGRWGKFIGGTLGATRFDFTTCQQGKRLNQAVGWDYERPRH